MTTAVARNGRANHAPLKVYGPNGVGKPAVPPEPATKRPGKRKPQRRPQNGTVPPKPKPAVERPLGDVRRVSPTH
jgi:hypothetical protein